MGGRSFGGDILFSHSGVSQNSSTKACRSRTMATHWGSSRSASLTLGAIAKNFLNYEGVAEYFWEMLIQPPQQ